LAAAAGLPQAQEVVVPTSDGEKLLAWYVAPKADKPLVVYFHGNGDTLSWRADRDRLLVGAAPDCWRFGIGAMRGRLEARLKLGSI
jgi:hypothetical protein